MLWVIIVSTIIFLFYRSNVNRKSECRYDRQFSINQKTITIVLCLVLLGTICAIFFPNVNSVAQIENYYLNNQSVYRQTIQLTKDAVITNLNTAGDLGIQLENQQHSKEIAERIKEMRNTTVEYNNKIAIYKSLKVWGWFLWPVLQYPTTPPINADI